MKHLSSNIILIFKDYPYFDNQLVDEIIALYKKEGKIIKAIQLQNSHDNLAIEQLITEIKLSKSYLVNVMFDEELSNTPYYTFLWTALGTLVTADLITITAYERHYKEIIFKSTNDPENQYLYMAAHFFKHHYIKRIS